MSFIQSLMDPAVETALITGLFAVIIAFMEKVRRDMKATRHQVQNDHKTNLREDIDEIKEGNRRIEQKVDEHDRLLRDHGKSLGGLREDARMERQERVLLGQRVESVADELRQHINNGA